jgi:hypothetical protein
LGLLREFVRRGGRVLVVAEEERRMYLETFGVNEIINPVLAELTTDH